MSPPEVVEKRKNKQFYGIRFVTIIRQKTPKIWDFTLTNREKTSINRFVGNLEDAFKLLSHEIQRRNF